jgi:hypothetical protein
MPLHFRKYSPYGAFSGKRIMFLLPLSRDR